jgi:hypothetical protein
MHRIAQKAKAWAHLLGFEHVPAWLLSPSTDNRVIAAALIVGAIYAFAVWPVPSIISRRRKADAKSELKYLSQRDSELGSAIISMARRSAWGRWYAAQHLVNSGERIREQHLYQTAASVVIDEILDGNLEVRGRRPDPKRLGYELIDRTHWRSSWLACVHDRFAIWKIKVVSRGTVEIDREGNTVRADNVTAAQRTSLLDYDSFTVDAYQFEKLWPAKDKLADWQRRKFLFKALWRGFDQDEIWRLL